ncbi:MAG: cytochrome C [Chloroflexi bacterium]|nr:cytochrome C [Chloroflexota bacterium]
MTLFLLLTAIAVFVVLQLVPYGRDHTNPPIVAEPKWDSPATRALAKRACFDCHSSETVWPWYANIAPASWLVYRDVVGARAEFSFSDWNIKPARLRRIVSVLNAGEMPPKQYLLLHPEARLTADEKAKLLAGMEKILQ